MAVYNLDPDFRRDAPSEGVYCCRCQKAIKDESKARPVFVDWDSWAVSDVEAEVKGRVERCLIGSDCWRVIVKAGERIE